MLLRSMIVTICITVECFVALLYHISFCKASKTIQLLDFWFPNNYVLAISTTSIMDVSATKCFAPLMSELGMFNTLISLPLFVSVFDGSRS